ncbi:MAG: glycosyltransferase [Candidatus Doudnabacteria bacterium]
MRIGLDLRMAGEEYGIGRYSFELAKKIAELDRENQYVFFVRDLAKFFKIAENRSNIEIIPADFQHYSLQEQVLFPKLIKAHNLQLMHFMNFNVPLSYSDPFIVTIHDMIHHRMPGDKNRRFFHRLAYKLVMRHAVLGSEKVITVSEFSKKEILSFYKVDPKKIKVIYEAAMPIPVTDSDVAEVRQRYSLTKPYIIFVGVMERKKNIVKLAQSFDILKDKYQLNIQLVLAGKQDSNYPEVLTEAKKIKYRKDLVLTGLITDKEKYSLYKGAEAFVSASLFEGFGLPGLEAMSSGIPLAVSNIEAFNEIYDNGAIYFNPEDPEDIAQKIFLLLNDHKYRELIANHAYSRAQNFFWDTAAKETIQMYNKIKR